MAEGNPLFRSSDDYEGLVEVGSGAYGTVFRARSRVTPDLVVAMKRVRIASTDDGIPCTTIREIAFLKQIGKFNNPHIVSLLDVCMGPPMEYDIVLYLVFEYMEQDLAKYLQKVPRTGLSPITIQRLSSELLKGIDFLHSHRIVHRDLKPQNLLLTPQETLKIADFGLARTYEYEMKLTMLVVTLWYRAPEVLLNQSYTSAIDIWSAGCIIAELFENRALFPGASEKNQLERIFNFTGTPSTWPEGSSIDRSNFTEKSSRQPRDLCDNLCCYSNDLLQQMLQYDSRSRPTAAECLQYPYFVQEPL